MREIRPDRKMSKLSTLQLEISVRDSLLLTSGEQHRDDHSADQGDQASNPDGRPEGAFI